MLTSTKPKKADGKAIAYEEVTFHNWGGTVQNKPFKTFYPKTIIGLQNIVTWAKTLGKRVRVSAYRHTWTDFYSQ